MIVHLIRTSVDRHAVCGLTVTRESASVWLRRVTCTRCVALADGRVTAPELPGVACSRCGLVVGAGWRRAHVCPHGKPCRAKRYRPTWFPVCTLCLFEYALSRAAVDGDD